MLKVYRIGLVDVALRAWLAGKGIQTSTIAPRNVKEFFGIHEASYKKRKTLAVKKARELIAEWQPDRLSIVLKERFLKARKKDDMADAFLQWMFFNQ